MPPERSCRWLALAAWPLLSAAPGQAPPLPPAATPPGFTVHATLEAFAQAPLVRASLAIDARTHLVAVGRQLLVAGDRLSPSPTTRTFASDVTFLKRSGAASVLVGTLGGRIVEVDARDLSVRRQMPGVPNMFDAVALAGGDLLVTANPLWPAPGAQSGVWHLRQGTAPREILPLSGPSGPLLHLENGDLVVAELGPITPPPPGMARLLRIPAAMLQGTLQGGPPLTTAQASEAASGYDGLYGLAEDDEGRVLSTDPGNARITATAPGNLAPASVWADLGPNRFATTLEFLPHAVGAFRAWQPPEHSPSLVVASGDFVSWFEVVRAQPMRPAITCNLAPVVPVGPSTLTLSGAPPGGIAVWLAATADTPEHLAATFAGSPIWLGIPLGQAVLLGQSQVDSVGGSTWTMQNPGGLQAQLRFQAVALAAEGAGSSAPVLLTLLP